MDNFFHPQRPNAHVLSVPQVAQPAYTGQPLLVIPRGRPYACFATMQPRSSLPIYQVASLPALAVFVGFSRTVRKQHIAHLHAVNASEYNYGPKWAESLISDDDVGIRAHIQQEPKFSSAPRESVGRTC